MKIKSESDLKKILKSTINLEILHIQTIIYNLLCAIKYLHESKVIHRDLKPANIFLSASGQVKVGDFGISRFLSASEALAHTQCGTPLYMSPEMARGQSYSRAADAWAVGCIMYEMMTLTAPWIGQLGARAAEGGASPEETDGGEEEEETGSDVPARVVPARHEPSG